MSVFVIVGKNEPIFEADFSTSTTSTSGKVRLKLRSPPAFLLLL
jgi:hypothetical protein